MAGLASALPAMGGELTASEARHFRGREFVSATACFDGTRGVARVLPDGSVDGSMQARGHWANALRHDAGRHAARRG